MENIATYKAGGIFSISSDLLYKYKKESYNNALNFLNFEEQKDFPGHYKSNCIEAHYFEKMYGKIFEEINMRHNVRPGLTGWAQVNGLRGDVEDAEENNKRTILRMKYDLWYIENWTMKLDIQIILMTIWQMIKGDTKAV